MEVVIRYTESGIRYSDDVLQKATTPNCHFFKSSWSGHPLATSPNRAVMKIKQRRGNNVSQPEFLGLKAR